MTTATTATTATNATTATTATPADAQYSGASVQATFDGFLFDMDGTIIDSTAAVEKHWEAEIGVAPEVILETSHGRRSIDILKILAPEKANWPYVCEMEGRLPKLYGDDAVEIPGARALLDRLCADKAPWAIVTSGTKPLVNGWIGVLGLPAPAHLVSAESVAVGKPDPACYTMGLEALGLAAQRENVLVLEDSPAGIRAGRDAGCKVLGLVTSHTAAQVAQAQPDWIVRDLDSVRVVSVVAQPGGGVQTTLEFSNLLAV